MAINKIKSNAYSGNKRRMGPYMGLGYAFLVLLLYVLLVLAGIWVYEYGEKRKEP